MTYKSKFKPGDRVVFGGDIPARVNAVQFSAYRESVPEYHISWIVGGALHNATVDEDEVRYA